MQLSGDVLYLLCNGWGLSWEPSDGLGVEITWKLLHSHVCCPAWMTQTSWILDKGTDMWTLCVAWALWGLDSEKEQAESKCCKKMDAPREASWLFLTFIGGHAPLLLPPRSKGRGNGAFFLMKMQPIHTEEEHVGWEMLQTIMIFRRYSLPHIGFQQQGYISCSYKVFCRSRQFSKADVLLLV